MFYGSYYKIYIILSYRKLDFFTYIYKLSFYDPPTFACFTLFFMTLLNENGRFLEYIQFMQSVQSTNAIGNLFPLSLTEFTSKNWDTPPKLDLFQEMCAFIY